MAPCDAGGNWNHNLHFHPLVLAEVPQPCSHALDIGCGEGGLARQLASRCQHVTGLDRDGPTLEMARSTPTPKPVDWRLGDLFEADLPTDSFDFITSIAALHHMEMEPALGRIKALLRPGGTLAVVGLARSEWPRDLPWAVAGTIATRYHRLRKSFREHAAPTIWPPPVSYRDVRRIAAEQLPGHRYRRHVLWRWSLVWRKPAPAAGPRWDLT